MFHINCKWYIIIIIVILILDSNNLLTIIFVIRLFAKHFYIIPLDINNTLFCY